MDAVCDYTGCDSKYGYKYEEQTDKTGMPAVAFHNPAHLRSQAADATGLSDWSKMSQASKMWFIATWAVLLAAVAAIFWYLVVSERRRRS